MKSNYSNRMDDYSQGQPAAPKSPYKNLSEYSHMHIQQQ